MRLVKKTVKQDDVSPITCSTPTAKRLRAPISPCLVSRRAPSTLNEFHLADGPARRERKTPAAGAIASRRRRRGPRYRRGCGRSTLPFEDPEGHRPARSTMRAKARPPPWTTARPRQSTRSVLLADYADRAGPVAHCRRVDGGHDRRGDREYAAQAAARRFTFSRWARVVRPRGGVARARRPAFPVARPAPAASTTSRSARPTKRSTTPERIASASSASPTAGRLTACPISAASTSASRTASSSSSRRTAWPSRRTSLWNRWARGWHCCRSSSRDERTSRRG